MENKKNDGFRHWAITQHLSRWLTIRDGESELEFATRERERLRELLESYDADFAHGQIEKCPTTAKYHLQAYLYFKKNRRGTSFKGMDCWSKGLPKSEAQDWLQYCSKKETRVTGPVFIGTKPGSLGEEMSYAQVLRLAQEGRWDEIPAKYRILYAGALEKIRARAIKATERDLPALWLWGKPRCGKSYYFRKVLKPTLDGKLYIKLQNKWWDRYDGESYVLLDDFDRHGAHLAHDLKLWLDVYETDAEVKGSATGLCYKQFFITSNYHPGEIWPNDPILVEAISKRCQVRYVEDRVLQWPEESQTDREYFDFYTTPLKLRKDHPLYNRFSNFIIDG